MDLSVFMGSLNILIIGICLCIGYVLKNIFPSDKINKYIPLIMAILGLILSVCTNLNKITLEVIFSGLFSGLASTGCYETFKNLILKEE